MVRGKWRTVVHWAVGMYGGNPHPMNQGNASSKITVFCPGFQKGRVPSEKGTLVR